MRTFDGDALGRALKWLLSGKNWHSILLFKGLHPAKNGHSDCNHRTGAYRGKRIFAMLGADCCYAPISTVETGDCFQRLHS
jgi:hypothetical protein